MSAGATRTGAPAPTLPSPASGGGSGRGSAAANPWAIAVLVALATFMEVLDTTIANVALRYIAGGLGVSEDEASWVVTTYLVSNAIILTASAFLAKTIGRKRFFLICLALFTASSVLCGIAWNLQTLLLFRIMQGLGGGGMVPVATSILVDRRQSAARPSRCTGLPWWWPRWSGRHWGAGCPTMSPGTGAF
jgi:DHA2 family multidrug resistance protein